MQWTVSILFWRKNTKIRQPSPHLKKKRTFPEVQNVDKLAGVESSLSFGLISSSKTFCQDFETSKTFYLSYQYHYIVQEYFYIAAFHLITEERGQGLTPLRQHVALDDQ